MYDLEGIFSGWTSVSSKPRVAAGGKPITAVAKIRDEWHGRRTLPQKIDEIKITAILVVPRYCESST